MKSRPDKKHYKLQMIMSTTNLSQTMIIFEHLPAEFRRHDIQIPVYSHSWRRNHYWTAWCLASENTKKLQWLLLRINITSLDFVTISHTFTLTTGEVTPCCWNFGQSNKGYKPENNVLYLHAHSVLVPRLRLG